MTFERTTSTTSRTRTTFDKRRKQGTNCEYSLRSLELRFVRPISRPFREKWENLSSWPRRVWEIDRVILPRLTLRHAHGANARIKTFLPVLRSVATNNLMSASNHRGLVSFNCDIFKAKKKKQIII